MRSATAVLAMHRLLRIRPSPVESLGLARAFDSLGLAPTVEHRASWPETRRAPRTPAPRLVVIDWAFAGEDSGAHLLELTTHWPASAVLVHSELPQSIYAERALRAGALGYLPAYADALEAEYALRAVLDGRIYLEKSFGPAFIRRLVQYTAHAPNPAQLSDRELAVLRHIGAQAPNRAIARALSISVKTVETHRANLKRKLGARDTAALRVIALSLHGRTSANLSSLHELK